MTPFLKNSLTVLGFLGLIYFGYYLYITQSDSVIQVDNNSRVTNQAEAETREFLRRLNQLKTVNFDEEFFSDQRFTSLVDHRQPVSPAPVGRENPFEPVF